MVFDVTIRSIMFRGNQLRFVVARDITNQVRMQKEQEIALAQIDSNILQLAILNDEVRNPLTVICGLLDDGICERHEEILVQVRKIDSIIDHLDRGYLDSEKVRRYLTRSFDLGRR